MIDLSMGSVSVAAITKALCLPTVNDCGAFYAFFGDGITSAAIRQHVAEPLGLMLVPRVS